MEFTVKNTDKIAFIADNSLAISKLFDIFAGKDTLDSGEFKWGKTTKPTYIPSSFSEFDGVQSNLVNYLRPYAKETTDVYLRGFLGRMLFTGEEALKNVSVVKKSDFVSVKSC